MTLALPHYHSSSDVYQPSEDTFLLMDAAKSFLKNHRSPSLILEIGSGTGVVAASVSFSVPSSYILASDVVSAATKSTKITLALNNISSTDVITGSYLSHWRPGLIDLVLFNPPYVPSLTVPNELTIDRAWAGGIDGAEVTRIFLQQLPRVLAPGGSCLLLLEKRNKPENLIAEFNHLFKFTPIADRKIRAEYLFVYCVQLASN